MKARQEPAAPFCRASLLSRCTACPWLPPTRKPTTQATQWACGQPSFLAERECPLTRVLRPKLPQQHQKAEVARIEQGCAELERRMRGLSSNQQRALLESMANTSNAVMGGLLADRQSAQLRGKGKGSSSRTETPHNQKVKATQASANNDPKYVKDLARVIGHVAAFQRHRSRLRGAQKRLQSASPWSSSWTTWKPEARIREERPPLVLRLPLQRLQTPRPPSPEAQEPGKVIHPQRKARPQRTLRVMQRQDKRIRSLELLVLPLGSLFISVRTMLARAGVRRSARIGCTAARHHTVGPGWVADHFEIWRTAQPFLSIL